MISSVHSNRAASGAERLTLVERPDEIEREGRASLIGLKVRDRDGREIGRINGVLAERSADRIRFVRISSGGFLGIGGQNFVAPIESVTPIDSTALRVDATYGDLRQAPTYGPDIVDERGWMEASYRHFGRLPE